MLSVIVRVTGALNLWGGQPNPLENFSQQKHGNLSRNLELFGFWAISLLRRAPRRQGVMVT